MFSDVVGLLTLIISVNSDINQAYDDQLRSAKCSYSMYNSALQLSITDWAFNGSHFMG